MYRKPLSTHCRSSYLTTGLPAVGDVYADPPDEHRDFPIDTFASDETYTISAWAINDDDEVISPVVKLKVRPKDRLRNIEDAFTDYKIPLLAFSGQPGLVTISGLTLTEFTVLK